MMTHYIVHFRIWNKNSGVYMHDTMGRLRSNPSHIFGSKKEIVMKVFSKFVGRFPHLIWGKFEGEWLLVPQAGFSFLFRKGYYALESKKTSIIACTLLLLETTQLPNVGIFPCAHGRRSQVKVTRSTFLKSNFWSLILLSDRVPNSLLRKDVPTQNDILHLDISSRVDISL